MVSVKNLLLLGKLLLYSQDKVGGLEVSSLCIGIYYMPKVTSPRMLKPIKTLDNRVPKCDVIKFSFLHFSFFMTIFQ